MLDERLLGSKWGTFSSLTELEKCSPENGRFSVMLDGGQFECLLLKKAAPEMFVLLSGARGENKWQLPQFDRWALGREFPGSVLWISDPTFYLAPETLKIGWYVGPASCDWTQSMSRVVLATAQLLQVPIGNITTWGSSSGGFASLMLSSHLRESTAIAINPQVDILKYHARLVDGFLSVAFGGRGGAGLQESERRRLSVLDTYRVRPARGVLIVQNVKDEFHYEKHFKPFCAAHQMKPDVARWKSGEFHTLLYDFGSGHGSEPRTLIPEILSSHAAMKQALPG